MTKIGNRFRKVFRANEKGFTLIELLVVISILGIIAGIVVLNVGGFMGSGCAQAAETELHQVQTAAMAVLADGGTLTTPQSGTPADDIADYLIGTLQGTYTIDVNTGEVTQTDDGC